MDLSPYPPTHHLMRVRVRTRIFDQLRDIAQKESTLTGDHTSISDLVRAALSDWMIFRAHRQSGSRAVLPVCRPMLRRYLLL